jgi:MFS-type transporter involved in bile tolerance (Atg22 family)
VRVQMTNLREVFAMKDRVNEGSAPILIILEKASMLVCLLIVVAIGLALELPSWGIGLMFGLSLGPIVFGHYYFIYIRPIKRRQQAKVEE